MHRYALIREGTRSASRAARRLLSIFWLTAAAAATQAGPIYKSVDANGNVVYSDHLDSSMSQPTPVQLEDPGLPPPVLHFCWTNCFTLILDQGVYRRTDGTEETWTVETFTPNAIVLHRHDAPVDWNGFSRDVVYAGHAANDRLIGVTVNGKPISGIDASWGNALNTLPGSNAERDAKGTATTNTPSSSAGGSGTVSTATTPPPLPAEEQPPLAEDGDLWTPGYWSWGNPGYVWVAGGWVRPPRVGVLWTPAYWAYVGNVYVFHPGYWGPTVGYYGGVNYGYGYFGNGYSGGHWIGNAFAYNGSVNHLNPAVVHHTYTDNEAHLHTQSASSLGGGSRGDPALHTVSQAQPEPRVVNRPATTTTVQRISAPTPKPVEPSRQEAAVKTPAIPAAQKINRVTPSRAAPIKQ
jgi:hypothetical protein